MGSIGRIFYYTNTSIDDIHQMNNFKHKLFGLISEFLNYIYCDTVDDQIYYLNDADRDMIKSCNIQNIPFSSSKVNILLELIDDFENFNINHYNISEQDFSNLKKIIFMFKISRLITNGYNILDMNNIFVDVRSYESLNTNNNINLTKYLNDNINILLDPIPETHMKNGLTFDGLCNRLN